jgi:hypothetical protein
MLPAQFSEVVVEAVISDVLGTLWAGHEGKKV